MITKEYAMDRKVSICVPTWNRFDFTTKCFEKILSDDRVGEVVISDDCSDDGSFEALKEFYSNLDKVKIYRNENRMKVHGNKHESIKKSTLDWCILFDSDNLLTKDYLDTIFSYDWQSNVAYQPSFAMPNFDYRNLVGTYDKFNIKEHLHLPLFECMLNTQNFFINRNNISLNLIISVKTYVLFDIFSFIL
jgi:glycosyltransferase involved in cell wall biosynthesis